MADSGRSGVDRRGREETQEQRIEREREEASDAERESADGPGYTAQPTDREAEEEPPRRGGSRP